MPWCFRVPVSESEGSLSASSERLVTFDSSTLFEIDHLAVGFGASPVVEAVRGVSMSLDWGGSLGVVGESGSGKSVTFLAALGLLAPGGSILSGSVSLNGVNLLTLPPASRRRHLGADLAMVFQNPTTALNPVLSVGAQIAESLRAHDRSIGKRDALGRAVDLLQRVGITKPERRARQYPHEFSGGMCQRAMIAIAIANQPKVLVADEPTTAVDVTIQAQLLDLLRGLVEEFSAGTILISHDLGVIAENTDRVMVMYGGKIMEEGRTLDVLADPRHPYTQGLLSCRPSLSSTNRLEPIPGSPPDPATLGHGCPFVARCPIGKDDRKCQTITPLLIEREGRRSACHYSGTEAFLPSEDALLLGGNRQTAQSSGEKPEKSLVSASCLRMQFDGSGLARKRRTGPMAVDGVDLALNAGETLGLVGESGSGKSTLARMVMRLLDPTDGSLTFAGRDVTRAHGKGLRALRDQMQIVFQDPFNSLNPRLSAADNAAEPLRLRHVGSDERRSQVKALFTEVGLGPQLLDRLPGELSGGQLQRVGIARALSVDPDILVLDEPVSALDVSVQAQILNLLRRLQEERNLAYLFISHDMAVVKYLCHRVAVMYMGRIVEIGAASTIFTNPQHPYTEGLLAAIPDVNAGTSRTAMLRGEQSRTASERGCHFRPRCPIAVDDCAVIDPGLMRIGTTDAACLVRARAAGVDLLTATKDDKA